MQGTLTANTPAAHFQKQVVQMGAIGHACVGAKQHTTVFSVICRPWLIEAGVPLKGVLHGI
jgi:hypothetical protein